MKHNRFWIIAFLIILISYSVSIVMLDRQSIRLDESQSLWAATKPISDVFNYTAQDVHVPLYNIMLHFWVQIFGTSIVALRFLSLVFSLLTLPVIYLLAKESSNQRVAAFTVVLFAVSPFIMWYSQEARMYTLFTFATALNQLYFLRLLRSQGKDHKAGFFLSALFGLYTHYFFIFVLITEGIYVIFRWIKQVYQDREAAKGQVSSLSFLIASGAFPFRFILLSIAAGLFLIPWLSYVISLGGAANTQPLIPPPTSFNLLQTFVNFIFGFQSQGIQAALISMWPLSIILFFFIFTQRKVLQTKELDYFVLATFLPIVLVFLGSYIKPIFLSRYLILVTPSLFYILAWSLLNYSRKLSTVLAAAFVFVMLGLSFYQNISASTPVKENYAGVDQFLKIQTTPKDIVAVSSPFTIYPIEYSYAGQAKIVTIPFWDRYKPGPIPPFSLNGLQSQISEYSTEYKRIFVVLSYDQGYESDIIDYLDHHYQLLQAKTFSPGLQVRVYKLSYS